MSEPDKTKTTSLEDPQDREIQVDLGHETLESLKIWALAKDTTPEKLVAGLVHDFLKNAG